MKSLYNIIADNLIVSMTGAPCVTLYRKESEDTARLLNLTAESRNLRLKCLPLWMALQAVGVDGLIERVKTAVQMVCGAKYSCFILGLCTHRCPR